MLITDLKAWLCSGRPFIDTRAPVEFARGSLPGAVNLPLMNDQEREQVGRCYKADGQAAAIALGHELVNGETKAARVAAWSNFAREYPDCAIFCFRGGLRSEIAQRWLAEAGFEIPRIAGGYKALRSLLMRVVDECAETQPLLIVGGRTGCAKTALLNTGCSGGPVPYRIDLEGLANHRGSAFGRRLGGQPSQISFEIALGVALLLQRTAQAPRLVLEDEGRLIGRCALPPNLHSAMKQAPLVLLEAPFEARVEHSFHNYILANLAELQAQEPDPLLAFAQFAKGLEQALANIAKRLGGARYQALAALLEGALARHQKHDDPSEHRDWIAPLLAEYYDPMYDHQLKGREHSVVARGDAATIAAMLCQS